MLKTVQLTPRVAEIQIPAKESTIRAFIVTTSSGPVLVDAGIAEFADEFVATVRRLNPRLLVVTERHWDHADGLPKITAALPDLKIAAHVKEAPGLPVPVDRLLEHDEMVVPGLRVLHVPGHSQGNIALLLEDEGTLLTGDSVFGKGDYAPELSSPPARYSDDAALAKENIKILLRYPFERAILSHGDHLLEDAKTKIAALVE